MKRCPDGAYGVGTIADDPVADQPSARDPAGRPPAGIGTTWCPTHGSNAMSGLDKIKNKAEELVGEAKEAIGKATDNEKLQAEGQADQTSANTKQAGEKVKDVFK
jgi:uncharacterized protein YjbJ (UPF0337 family)